jgi:hypothetical protein
LAAEASREGLYARLYVEQFSRDGDQRPPYERPARRRTALTAAGGHRVNVRCVTPLGVETASMA